MGCFSTRIPLNLGPNEKATVPGTCCVSGLPFEAKELIRVVQPLYVGGVFKPTADTGHAYRADVLLNWRFVTNGDHFISSFERADKVKREAVEAAFKDGYRVDAMNRALSFSSWRGKADGGISFDPHGGRQFTTFAGWWKVVGSHAAAFRADSKAR